MTLRHLCGSAVNLSRAVLVLERSCSLAGGRRVTPKVVPRSDAKRDHQPTHERVGVGRVMAAQARGGVTGLCSFEQLRIGVLQLEAVLFEARLDLRTVADDDHEQALGVEVGGLFGDRAGRDVGHDCWVFRVVVRR